MRAGGRPGYDVIVPAGETVEVLSPVAVPWALGIGDHTAASRSTLTVPAIGRY